ncbi:MAG TPA: delta-60 repeat domain-containing protein [Planctomycetota bacterium]|nr:delta-60 repeat domain-containing protein [Planctomycetota bacterium]
MANHSSQQALHRHLRDVLRGLAGGAALALSAAPLAAQGAGALDPGFGAGGKAMFDFQQSTDIAHAVAVQPDGKLVIAGLTYTDNDYSKEDFALLRLQPDGTPDASFGVGGRVTTDFPGLAAVVSSVVVQPDGKLLVAGGAFPLVTFLGDFKLARYNPDGSLDEGFGAGGIVTTSFPGQGSYAFALALQPDGRILAAGTDFVNFSGGASSDTDFALARYLPDGTPDSSFGNGGTVVTDIAGFDDDVFSVLLQPDGRIVAVGSARTLATHYDFAAARYLPDGTLDASFGTGGTVRTDFGNNDFDRAHAACLQPDGKLLAAGFTIFNGGLSQPFALARYGTDGTLDSSFDGDGKLLIDFGSFSQAAHALLAQPDGKLVVVGFADTESSDSDFLLARCDGSGALDASFGVGGKVRTSFGNLNGGAFGAALQTDGRIVAAGFQATFTSVGVELAVARYLGDSPWTNLGGALAGIAGPPRLAGTGTLFPGSSGGLSLAAAAPSAAGALFFALDSTPAPFHCGTLVPVPVLGTVLLLASATGTASVTWSSWPAGLSGLDLFLQAAVQDAAAPCNVALSNALLADVP